MEVNTNFDCNMTFRCEKGLREEFMKTADSMDRPAAQLLREFMRTFVIQHKPQISAEERARRLEEISYAKATLELEGETISPELLDAAMKYANGDISYETLMAVGA